MKAGFKVETRPFNKWCKVLIVCNYDLYNLVVNWPSQTEPAYRNGPDVGIWRIKQLKK
jgi:hypothetical protein